MKKVVLVLLLIAALIATAAAENAISKLKAKIEGAPCDKKAAGPAPPRQFLDIRLPHVVDDYHPPAGGFNPTDIPSKEVDIAARKILREIQAAEAEAKANGDEPQKDDNGILSTEEHKALKQLLLDADILVRAASKSLSEVGPIEESAVKKVAASAVKKAAKAEKKQIKKAKKAAKKAEKAAKKATKAAAKATKAAAAAAAAPAKPTPGKLNAKAPAPAAKAAVPAPKK